VPLIYLKMVYDEGDHLRDQEERRREKFSRERGDYSIDRGRRNFAGADRLGFIILKIKNCHLRLNIYRRDYSNGLGVTKKRPFREEETFQSIKRSRLYNFVFLN
jgi:hypothetical protein